MMRQWRGHNHSNEPNLTSRHPRYPAVRIAKPMLLVTTPIGLIEGVYECYKLAGGLVFIMLAMLMVMFCAAATVVIAIRREEAKPAEEDRWKS
jgi:hypothetical protein